MHNVIMVIFVIVVVVGIRFNDVVVVVVVFVATMSSGNFQYTAKYSKGCFALREYRRLNGSTMTLWFAHSLARGKGID